MVEPQDETARTIEIQGPDPGESCSSLLNADKMVGTLPT